VSKLSEFKKQLVRDIGFGGLLEVPCISKIYVHEKDIGVVFGLPCSDIDVHSVDLSAEHLEDCLGKIHVVSNLLCTCC